MPPFGGRRHYSHFAAQCQENQGLRPPCELGFRVAKKSRRGACKNATMSQQVGENREIDSARFRRLLPQSHPAGRLRFNY
ncbi:hypothetical protein EKH55_0123 [Sinorhizobium alkalisoli]|nr:hypothetical protein EKH55_0123 [Sinorhizobium alkalisoli]